MKSNTLIKNIYIYIYYIKKLNLSVHKEPKYCVKVTKRNISLQDGMPSDVPELRFIICLFIYFIIIYINLPSVEGKPVPLSLVQLRLWAPMRPPSLTGLALVT